MSFPSTASFPASASYPAAAAYPASASYPGAAAPWTPAQYGADLLAFLDGIVGAYGDNPPVTPATDGGTIAALKALYGSTNNATAAGAQQPIWQSMFPIGVSFATDASQWLDTASNIVLDPSVGWTFYGVVNSASFDIALAGNTVIAGVIGTSGGTLFVGGDDAVYTTITPTTPFSGIVLVRADCDSSGNLTADCTGSGGAATGTVSTFTINQIGQGVGAGLTSDSGARGVAWEFVNRRIVQGSPEDLQNRTFITNTYGASL